MVYVAKNQQLYYRFENDKIHTNLLQDILYQNIYICINVKHTNAHMNTHTDRQKYLDPVKHVDGHTRKCVKSDT